MTALSRDILWLKQVSKEDTYTVGKVGITLGELTQAGFPLPDGFIVTTDAYFHFLHENKLIPKINQLLSTINYEQPEAVMQISKHIQKLIMQTPITDTFLKAIDAAYRKLSGAFHNTPVSITFSLEAYGKKHPQTVSGEANLVLQVKQAWASLFEPQALLSRQEQHSDYFRTGIAVIIQKMTTPSLSGTLMTQDPITPDKTKLIIEVENGTTDYYTVDKKALQPEIFAKNIAGNNQKITDAQILALASLGQKIEKHFYFPQEITWAIEKKTIMLLQIKPLAINQVVERQPPLTSKLTVLLRGIPASRGRATGPVRIITTTSDEQKIMHRDIVVISDSVNLSKNILKKAAAIITDKGGRTAHGALLAREFGIPAVVATEHATKNLRNGQIITVDGTKGEIYKGTLTTPHRHTATRLYTMITDAKQIRPELKEESDGILLLQNIAHRKLFPSQTIIYRLSDPLPDGKSPLFGFHGTYRHLHERQALKGELDTLKQIQQYCNNLIILLPYVRSVKELISIKQLMADYGISRSTTCKIWLSISIPANVILLEAFIKEGLDGVAIDTDTLSMLLLGTNKDDSTVAHAYDDLDPAVLSVIEQVVKTAQRHSISSSIYGHAPSHHSSLIEQLVTWGITSICVEEDKIVEVKQQLIGSERRLITSKSL